MNHQDEQEEEERQKGATANIARPRKFSIMTDLGCQLVIDLDAIENAASSLGGNATAKSLREVEEKRNTDKSLDSIVASLQNPNEKEKTFQAIKNLHEKLALVMSQFQPS